MNRRQVNAAIKKAPNHTIQDICNICNNYYRNPAIRLEPQEVQSLRKHKRLILGLVNKRSSLKKKRELMTQQSGGLFPLLALIPAIAAKIGIAAATGAASAAVGAGIHKAING